MTARSASGRSDPAVPPADHPQINVFTRNHVLADGIHTLASARAWNHTGRLAPSPDMPVNVVDADTCDPDDVLRKRGAGPLTILVLSPHGCLELLRRHLGTTVGAALVPWFATDQFFAALDTVTTGGLYLHEAFIPGLRFSATVDTAAAHDARLTSRELEIHSALCRALSNQQIADAVGVSPRTVRFHVSNILKKLDLPTRSHVIAAQSPTGGIG